MSAAAANGAARPWLVATVFPGGGSATTRHRSRREARARMELLAAQCAPATLYRVTASGDEEWLGDNRAQMPAGGEAGL